jgi:hypothetical protein
MVIPSSKVKLLNKVDIYVPQWISTFGGVISFLLVKELTVQDIIEEYIQGGGSRIGSPMDIRELKEAEFIDLSIIQDLKNSIQRKGTCPSLFNQLDLKNSIQSLDKIHKLTFQSNNSSSSKSNTTVEEDDDIIVNQNGKRKHLICRNCDIEG